MRIPKDVVQALEATQLPWEIKDGGKHFKITLSGRMVGILPKGTSRNEGGRALLNLLGQIRRAAKQIREGG